jgi:hypothetical protein
MRIVLLLAALAAPLLAASIRLYLTDGEYQLVREYKIEGDRVRFLSAERGEWEEIPLELVDLKRTEQDAAARQAAAAEAARREQAEDEAIRADRRLAASVPETQGPYLAEGQKLTPLAEAQVTIEQSGARKILQALTPAPIIPGKSTVTIAGKAAKFRITDPTPEFFFRLGGPQRLAIVQLTVKKNERVVEEVTIMPNDAGIFEDQKQIATFKKQHELLLYKIWPEQPLEPGEYALVEYTEGKINLQVWDFGVDRPRK